MADTEAQIFGANIRRLRLQQHMTLEELSERCGLSPNYIGSVELGKRDPSLSTIHSLAEGLNVTPRDLFPGEDSRSPAAMECARIYDDASEEQKEAIRAILKGMVQTARHQDKRRTGGGKQNSVT